MTYIQPVFPLLILLLAIVVVRHASPRWRRVGMGSVAVLFLWSFIPFAVLSSLTLEWRYGVAPPPEQDAGAIVVLAGGIYPPETVQREAAPAWSTFLRCRYAAWVYKHWRAIPVIVSGGQDNKVTAATVMRRALEAEGVPPAVIFTEDRSTSTYTNAVFTASLLRARGIRKVVLVTEAFHMWRSELCFRQQGIEVVPAPCAFRSARFDARWFDFVPQARAMDWNSEVLHEWVGIAWYWISGKISRAPLQHSGAP